MTMNPLRKILNTWRAFRTAGLGGTARRLRARLAQSGDRGAQRAARELFGDEPLFRYATCNDLINLMARYPQYCRVERDSEKSAAWGLKAAGTLFCADRIARFKPQRVLEVGAGWTTHFDQHFGSQLDYWMLDDASDIGGDKVSRDKFERSLQGRQHTHFVRGLLGSFLPALADASFDLVFSISVIEHVPAGAKRNFYADMFRILKPGGMIAHSIDIADPGLGQAELEVIQQAGFRMPAQADLRIRTRPDEGDPTLFEDLWTVFHGYMGRNRPDKWTDLQLVPFHQPTIFAFGYKPG
jgi:SAM-dependent methyltransferase